MGVWIIAGVVLILALLVRWRHALRGWLVAFGSRWTGGAVPGASYRCAAAGEFIYCGGVWYFGPAGSH